MRAIRDADIAPPLCSYVLMTMATYADPDGGGIHPGLRTLAERTGLDHRTVRKHVRACVNAGYLVQTRQPRQNYATEYRLDLGALRGGANVPPDDLRGGAVALRGGAVASQRGRQCTPTCKDLDLPGAPPAAPAQGPAAGASNDPLDRLRASVHEHEWRGILGRLRVVEVGERVVVAFGTALECDFADVNHRDTIARAFAVEPGAVEFTNGRRR